jgi:UDP-3-O-[3-hydroxymyristoyl] glucosamine N-acyltransferase
MIIANDKPIKIIGYTESSMTHEFVNEISKTRVVDVVAPSDFLILDNKEQYQYIVSVTVDLAERKQMIDVIDTLMLDLITVINDTALIDYSPKPNIAPGTFIFPFCNIGLGSNIGQHCIVGCYTLVGHYSTIGKNCILRPGVMIHGKSQVGNNCVINTRATVTNGVQVADNIKILGFSAVVKNLDTPGTYIGCPARRSTD